MNVLPPPSSTLEVEALCSSEFCCSSTKLHRRLTAMRLSVFTDLNIFYIIICY